MNLKNYYNNILMYDFITKFKCKNIFEIPKITKIFLSFGYKNSNMNKKKLINIFFLLRILSNQNVFAIKSKKTVIALKIKKNSIIGCKTVLIKKNIYNFLDKIFFFLILKDIINLKDYKINNNTINFKIKDFLKIDEIQNEVNRFNKLPPLNISIHMNKSDNLKMFLNYMFLSRK